MKVLITGGAGMVGSHAAVYYSKKGNEVIAFDNLMRSKLFGYDKKSVEYNWNFLKGFSNVKRVVGDVRKPADLEKVMNSDIDLVIHTAGQPGVGYSLNDPAEDYSINAYGTFNVLDHVRRKCPEACVVYCSTNKVYGENVSNIPLAEKSTRYCFKKIKAISEDFGIDMTAHTPYGVSKYVGDIYAQEFSHSYGIKTGIFRMSCIYGTRQFGFEDQGWLAHFIISNVMSRPVTIYGDGKQVRDVLYVEDLIAAYDFFYMSSLKSGIFNIGGGEENTISLLEFIKIIETKTGKKMKVGYAGWRPSDQKVYISDISKVKKALGWKPRVNVDEGIGNLIEWVRKNREFFR